MHTGEIKESRKLWEMLRRVTYGNVVGVQQTGRTTRGSRWMTLGLGVLCIAGVGCKDLTQDPGLPAGTPDPATYNSADGAIGMRAAAVYQLNMAIPPYLRETGLLSDELIDSYTGSTSSAGQTDVQDPVDERLLPEGVQSAVGGLDGRDSYAYLQSVRGAVNVALGALATYDTAVANRASQHILRGELYALEGYAEVLLADFFCSGVPLSTLDYKQDFTYRPSSNSAQVYADARTKLDSALALSAGNDSVLNMARVLKGRAQLALGNYAAAADDVALVPTTFQYRLTVQLNPLNDLHATQPATVADHEGGNGLPFISSGDPRSAVTITCSPSTNFHVCPLHPLTAPAKYFAVRTTAGYAPFVVASGIEARLIEAEAALHDPSRGNWLARLNTLRYGGTSTVTFPDTVADTLGFTGCTAAGACDPNGFQIGFDYASLVLVSSTSINLAAVDVPGGIVDECRTNNPSRTYACIQPTLNVYVDPTHTHTVTVVSPGTGGVSGLASLSDPGTAAARVALVFQERAYWLFLTGHRQGDLRRLIRQYGGQYPEFRSQQQVYPTGIYMAPGTGRYGSDITAPIPTTEYANPNYHGCLDRNA